MRRFVILIILLSIVASQESFAQKRKADRAYASFEAGEYYDAIDLFKDAYSKNIVTNIDCWIYNRENFYQLIGEKNGEFFRLFKRNFV